MIAPRSDEELLAAWRAGERRAGELLFERYYEPVARFFFNKTDAAAELIQQTFLACVEGAAKFRGPGARCWRCSVRPARAWRRRTGTA